MKLLLTLAWLAICLPAMAQTTITLQPSGCAATRNCGDVHNGTPTVNADGDPVFTDEHEIALYAAPTYPGFTLILDGVSYYSPTGNGGFTGPVDGVAYTTDGRWAQVHAEFFSQHVCGHSGRGGGYCHTNWSLTGGTVTVY